jgi:protein-tyrosine phosphatase
VKTSSPKYENRKSKSEKEGRSAVSDFGFRISDLFTDIHCHLLPGIDDGPEDWETSLTMARMAVAEGLRTIVATPHQLGRYEKNTAERILLLAAEAQQRIKEAGLPLTILPGADVRIQENLPELVETGQVLTLGNRRPKSESVASGQWPVARENEPGSSLATSHWPLATYLLMELPHEQALPMGRLIYELQCQGVTSILSHPERNQHLQGNPEILRPWVQQGCLIQVTAGSITGEFGRQALQMSRWLFRQNLVHLVASDAHDVHVRPPRWRQAFAKVFSWHGRARAEKVFFENPEAVVQGRPIDAPLPSSAPGTGFAAWFGSALAALRG